MYRPLPEGLTIKKSPIEGLGLYATKDITSEVVVIGGGYTGLLCAINLIENYDLDVILLDAGKVGWGASSRNAGFNCLPPSKMSFKKMQSIYGVEETNKFFKNSVSGSN